MQYSDTLQKMGLSEKESAIYLALLETGPATISEVARKSGIHRPLIYKTLPGLEQKGLISKGPKGKLVQYVAEPPAKLATQFERLRADFDELLPQLEGVYTTADKKPIVKFLEGKHGIMSVFDDLVATLPRGGMFYRYSSAKDLAKNERYLPEDYRKKRDNKQLERLVITSEARAKAKKPRLERDLKTISADYDLFDDDITQIIYGNKVAFVDYNSETAILVESKVFADFQRKLFTLLYRNL
jgi:sugar-specific transcriptional regulator TrmB